MIVGSLRFIIFGLPARKFIVYCNQSSSMSQKPTSKQVLSSLISNLLDLEKFKIKQGPGEIIRYIAVDDQSQ